MDRVDTKIPYKHWAIIIIETQNREDSMFKRLLLGIIAVSALALLWSEANAQDCVRWRRVGGSNVCVAYSTGSIIVQIQFRQDCGPDGSGCEADIFAESSNNIAFCVNPANPSGPPSRTTCNESVTFSSPAETCEPKHEQDGTTDGGVGHVKGHKCTSTTPSPPPQLVVRQPAMPPA